MSFMSKQAYDLEAASLERDLELGDITIREYTRLMNDLDAEYYGEEDDLW